MGPHDLALLIFQPPLLALPFFVHSAPKTLAFFLSANISKFFMTQGICTAHPLLVMLFAWLSLFHHSIFKSQKGLPDYSTAAFLFPQAHLQ